MHAEQKEGQKPFMRVDKWDPMKIVSLLCISPNMIPALHGMRRDGTGLVWHGSAFPMGLPEFDPVRLTIEGGEGLEVSESKMTSPTNPIQYLTSNLT